MKIPDELKVLANRYGNKVMIKKIMSNLSKEQKDDLELIGILSDRKGIVVLQNGNKITLLNIIGGVQITSKPKKKSRKRKKKED